jgi:hypothetical protein
VSCLKIGHILSILLGSISESIESNEAELSGLYALITGVPE